MKNLFALPVLFLLVACGGNNDGNNQTLTGTYSALVVNSMAEYDVDIVIDESGVVTGTGTYQSNVGIPAPHSVTVSGNALSNNRLDMVFTHPSTSQVENISFTTQNTTTGFTGLDTANPNDPNLQFTITADRTP